jgi:hypothetical protein
MTTGRTAAQTGNFSRHRAESSKQTPKLKGDHLAGCCQGGPQLPYLNPHHEVVHQNEPTPSHPVSQHKQFKGHSTAHSAGRPIK